MLPLLLLQPIYIYWFIPFIVHVLATPAGWDMDFSAWVAKLLDMLLLMFRSRNVEGRSVCLQLFNFPCLYTLDKQHMLAWTALLARGCRYDALRRRLFFPFSFLFYACTAATEQQAASLAKFSSHNISKHAKDARVALMVQCCWLCRRCLW